MPPGPAPVHDEADPHRAHWSSVVRQDIASGAINHISSVYTHDSGARHAVRAALRRSIGQAYGAFVGAIDHIPRDEFGLALYALDRSVSPYQPAGMLRYNLRTSPFCVEKAKHQRIYNTACKVVNQVDAFVQEVVPFLPKQLDQLHDPAYGDTRPSWTQLRQQRPRGGRRGHAEVPGRAHPARSNSALMEPPAYLEHLRSGAAINRPGPADWQGGPSSARPPAAAPASSAIPRQARVLLAPEGGMVQVREGAAVVPSAAMHGSPVRGTPAAGAFQAAPGPTTTAASGMPSGPSARGAKAASNVAGPDTPAAGGERGDGRGQLLDGEQARASRPRSAPAVRPSTQPPGPAPHGQHLMRHPSKARYHPGDRDIFGHLMRTPPHYRAASWYDHVRPAYLPHHQSPSAAVAFATATATAAAQRKGGSRGVQVGVDAEQQAVLQSHGPGASSSAPTAQQMQMVKDVLMVGTQETGQLRLPVKDATLSAALHSTPLQPSSTAGYPHRMPQAGNEQEGSPDQRLSHQDRLLLLNHQPRVLELVDAIVAERFEHVFALEHPGISPPVGGRSKRWLQSTLIDVIDVL